MVLQVLVVDDHPLFRAGVVAALAQDHRTVGVRADVEGAVVVEKVKELK